MAPQDVTGHVAHGPFAVAGDHAAEHELHVDAVGQLPPHFVQLVAERVAPAAQGVHHIEQHGSFVGHRGGVG
jgi:hypothetical protein